MTYGRLVRRAVRLSTRRSWRSGTIVRRLRWNLLIASFNGDRGSLSRRIWWWVFRHGCNTDLKCMELEVASWSRDRQRNAHAQSVGTVTLLLVCKYTLPIMFRVLYFFPFMGYEIIYSILFSVWGNRQISSFVVHVGMCEYQADIIDLPIWTSRLHLHSVDMSLMSRVPSIILDWWHRHSPWRLLSTPTCVVYFTWHNRIDKIKQHFVVPRFKDGKCGQPNFIYHHSGSVWWVWTVHNICSRSYKEFFEPDFNDIFHVHTNLILAAVLMMTPI